MKTETGIIKALVMDIDGTLTDGSIFISDSGECMKRFYVRDGLAIKHILPEYGIVPIIITGRKSEIVSTRCRELDIDLVFQGCNNKKAELDRILSSLGISYEETAYIGDDINDYECMELCGITGCPKDAVPKIKEIADFISSFDGGQGAVREFIEHLAAN